jgi:hypothetical protein
VSAAALDPDVARRLLRAYEQPLAVRIAKIIVEYLAENGRTGSQEISRAEIARVWGIAWPRDTAGRGQNSIPSMIRRNLATLEFAGMIRREGTAGPIVALDQSRLAMAAGNLAVVEDEHGKRIPRDQWRRLPDVPDELVEAQIDAQTGVRRD